MMPAASMDAAQAPHPDFLIGFMGEVSRHLAMVEVWVPHFLDELVGGVCQRFPLVIEPRACDRRI
jgi:hypothetical protein